MAFLAVAGCTRFGGKLDGAFTVFATSVAERSAGAGESTQVNLTSASMPMPRLAFTTAETPVEELLPAGDQPLPMNGLCPPDMASIEDRYCVDKYEASLVEVLPTGEERAWPYYQPVDKGILEEGHIVRAVSEKGVYPQGYISGKQAAAACKASGKRLCRPAEWRKACKGPSVQQFGYGELRKPGVCNDTGKSAIGFYHGVEIANGTAFSSFHVMNDPKLNQLPGTLAETGSHEGCTNGYGVQDMVGNIHEWVDDPEGTFQGGYYLDVTQNGGGCGYRTDAHNFTYHDYSTGFRCCADIGQ